MTNITKKMTKRIFAIDAAPVAMPPNPKIAATMARMKKVMLQLNMGILLAAIARGSAVVDVIDGFFDFVDGLVGSVFDSIPRLTGVALDRIVVAGSNAAA